MRLKQDPNESFKLVFMKVANDYVTHPSPKKQKALGKLVRGVLEKDPDLLCWFNVMFNWRNTEDGVELAYKIKVPRFPS